MQTNREYRWATYYGEGYTWKPISVANNLLREAERLFGPMQSEFRYIGVEYGDVDCPKTWYPQNTSVSILIMKQLSESPSWFNMVYQVSHEVIHVLCSRGGRQATHLEEGLATWFSVYGCLSVLGDVQNQIYTAIHHPHSLNAKYREAYSDYLLLINLVPDAIKMLRQHKPILSDLTIEEAGKILPEVDEYMVEKLFRLEGQSIPSSDQLT